MLSVLIILIATAAYGALHSWLASLRAKAWARRELGERTARFYRLAFNLVGGLTLLPLAALVMLLPDEALYSIPAPWLYLALLAELLGVAIMTAAVLQTGWQSFSGLDALPGTPAAPSGPPHLVTGGLYRWVRHPIYTGTFLVMAFFPVMTRNLLALFAALAVYMVVGAWLEERKLLAEFGPRYAAYQRQVGMFLPRLSADRSRRPV